MESEPINTMAVSSEPVKRGTREGVILRRVRFPAGAHVRVNHDLGWMPTRWRPVRVTDGPFQAFEVAADPHSITFESQSACVVDLELGR